MVYGWLVSGCFRLAVWRCPIAAHVQRCSSPELEGSWDLASKIMNKVAILLITYNYNPNGGTYTLLSPVILQVDPKP